MENFVAYIVKRVLRGFATIKSLTLWKVTKGQNQVNYARLSRLYRNQVVQDSVGKQRLKMVWNVVKELYETLQQSSHSSFLEGKHGWIICGLYIVKRVLRGFATIKLLMLWKVSKG